MGGIVFLGGGGGGGIHQSSVHSDSTLTLSAVASTAKSARACSEVK